MTITLDLSEEEEARLIEKAERAGLAPADLIRQFITADDKLQADLRTDPNYRDSWSDDDLREFTAAAAQRIERDLGDEPDYNDV